MTNLYVENIHEDVTEAMLHDIFRLAGALHSIWLCRGMITHSFLGSAYVNFHSSHSAKLAMNALNLFEIKGQQMRITWSQHHQSEGEAGKVFITNLEKSINTKALTAALSTFGNVLACEVIQKDSGGYGFAQFETQESADRAIERLNGMLFNDQQVSLRHYYSNMEWNLEQHDMDEEKPGPAQEEREQQMETRNRGFNLYIRNLHDTIDNQRLWQEFSPFGTIFSAKVMMVDGHSKGFGFVCFLSQEDANNAMAEMNGRVVETMELYVAPFQPKAERQAMLRRQYLERQTQVPAAAATAAPVRGVPHRRDAAGGRKTQQKVTAQKQVTRQQPALPSGKKAKPPAQVPPSKPKATQSVRPQNSQNMPDAMHPSAPRPRNFGRKRPAFQVAQTMSAQPTAKQSTRHQRGPAGAAAAAPLH